MKLRLLMIVMVGLALGADGPGDGKADLDAGRRGNQRHQRR